MTEKIHTDEPKSLNMTENSHKPTLTFELDRNMDELDQN